MGDMAETFQAMREDSKQRKEENHLETLRLLVQRGVHFQRLSESHYRMGDFDFWPSTGTVLDRRTKRYSRGMHKLLSKLGL